MNKNSKKYIAGHHGLGGSAIVRKFHEAKINNEDTVVVWGSGKVSREFLFVDDLAKACVHLMVIDKQKYQSVTKPMFSHINIGTGEDVTIKELAGLIKKIVNFQGKIIWDNSKPDGTTRKLLNVSKINQLGWKFEMPLKDGLFNTYQWFIKNEKNN